MKRVLLGLLAVVAVLALGFVIWASAAAKPTDAALRALESDKRVSVVRRDGFITFSPAGTSPTTGFIFYPGGRVDYRAYAPVLRMIAEQGYFVALVKVNLNLAFFEINAADDVISAHPEVAHWAVGGHSLGGVAASSYASGRPEVVSGVVFWASYPADDSLKGLAIPVLSVFGSNDGLSTLDTIEESRALLPPDTVFVLVEGGNHAQFGSYGEQSGDNPALIPAEEQWAQVAEATAKFLETLKAK
ncbi:MAG TPA: alpha/beta hydrolase [Anaerolineales bacterium]|nr:alpha/beta hydrolase [Anaerolineales bacterium]